MRAFYVFISFLLLVLVMGFFMYMSNNTAQKDTSPPPTPVAAQPAPPVVETHIIEVPTPVASDNAQQNTAAPAVENSTNQ